ncbi:uncharacterized protein HMPREF1120_03922 [Exophiala dermatitidis NIH/UT8656]|uniref:Uncharacterized protein n=1 Tax=Exophiala dermatitidis (strain ATCC 34100 / CBS 525.76 / NIH/UT8656) TaxID=858893 RepID=H6BV17_EXODN|nr:uncharacterized protein HMPREF1120_03922 [Exophiala dermatitidis NIH/UT8656]EHY55800.1 hypothetical protein HMPREF1120_03922 [Exophiala dermatitidis NIH/UT8656]
MLLTLILASFYGSPTNPLISTHSACWVVVSTDRLIHPFIYRFHILLADGHGEPVYGLVFVPLHLDPIQSNFSLVPTALKVDFALSVVDENPVHLLPLVTLITGALICLSPKVSNRSKINQIVPEFRVCLSRWESG